MLISSFILGGIVVIAALCFLSDFIQRYVGRGYVGFAIYMALVLTTTFAVVVLSLNLSAT